MTYSFLKLRFLKFDMVKFKTLIFSLLFLSLSCGNNSIDSKRTMDGESEKSPRNFHSKAPIGTQVLAGSKKNHSLRWNTGFLFKEVELTPCQETGEPDLSLDKNISNIILTDSSLTVEFRILENCCNDFLCEAEYIDEETLNLIYTGYGSYCSCSCCFGLKYEFEIIRDDGVEGIDPNKLKYLTIGGDMETKRPLKNEIPKLLNRGLRE